MNQEIFYAKTPEKLYLIKPLNANFVIVVEICQRSV